MICRHIGAAHAFEYLRGDSRDESTWVPWSFTIMRMSKGSYTVVLIRDWHEVFTLEYRDLYFGVHPSKYRRQSPGKIDDIPDDVMREVERGLAVVARGGSF